MASIVLFTTITIVVPSSLICERRSFLFNSIKAQKADPQHFNNDKEESNRNLDKNKGQPGGHVIARSPLYWSLKSYKKHFEDVRAAQNQMHKLQNKLLTNNVIPIKIFNQLHPKQNVHLKSSEHKQEKIKVVQAESPVRKKREVVIHPQTQPEMVMQPNIQPALLQQAEARDNRPSLLFHFFNPSIYYPEVVDALSNNSGHYQDKIIEKKRDKRQILLMIKQRRPIVLTKKARTTPNPFIPETNNADYDIMKPDIYRPEVDIDNTDSYQLRRSQSLIQYLQSVIFNFGQKHSKESILISHGKDLKDEIHIRVKRRMSRFVRDKKQMNRKKKIGRRKKTKVKRAPIKLKKWYHSRQKVKKKGDGTYRGGRGRKPRQHRKPKFHKQVQNDTSDDDYYDNDGNIREPSGETQEGSDDAEYVSYGSGEYADTAEAEAAHQELEKEYQMQLVKKRRKEEKRRMSNGTYVSSEESLPPPYVSTEEDVSNKTKSVEDEYEEYYEDEEEGDEEEYEEGDTDETSSGSHSSSGKGRKNSGRNDKNINNMNKGSKNKPLDEKQDTKKATFTKPYYKKQQQRYIDKAIENSRSHLEQMHLQRTRGNQNDLGQMSKVSQDVRITAKKLNIMSQAALPSFRNSLHQIQPSNWMTSVKFEVPQGKMLKNVQSLKKTPDVNSITDAGLASIGGKSMLSLQSKKENRIIESKPQDNKLGLSSIVKDKTENDQKFTSKTKDTCNKLTSIIRDGSMKHFLSKTRDMGLTSIANHIPMFEIITDEVEKDKKIVLEKMHKNDTKTVNAQKNQETLFKDNRGKRESIKDARNINLHTKKASSYGELSFVPDIGVGISAPTDEIEEAPDDVNN